MKTLILAAFMAVSSLGIGQTTEAPTFIKGNLNIRYNSRLKPGELKIWDQYDLNLNVSNSVVFKGTINHYPIVVGGIFSDSIKQESVILYDVGCDVVNPKNPLQTKNIGKIFGKVPLSADGSYRYNNGNLKINIYPMGTSRGIDSKFDGSTVGKPLHKPKGFTQKAKEKLRMKSGKSGLTVTNYDLMEFRQHVIPMGPVPVYPEIVVNGAMVFDYDRSCWYFHNMTITYSDSNNRNLTDKISGLIRWIEAEDRDSTGKGHYDFDVRVNEPVATESSAFTQSDDENSFFETAPDISSLGGVMNYTDTMSGDKVTASAIEVDLKGNKLTKQQTMNLCKIVIFSSLIPLNAE